MASFLSGEDEKNPALRLAAQACKMVMMIACSGLSVVSCRENLFFIINPLLAKLVQSQ